MIKNIIKFSLTLAVMTAYTATGHAQAACNNLKTDSIRLSIENKFAECKVTVDAPVKNNNALEHAVNKYINTELGNTEFGLVKDVTAVIDINVMTSYCKKRMEAMNNEAKELYGEDQPTAPYSYYADIRKIYENEKMITYSSTISTYSGGAHPLTSYTGTTFSKQSCSEIGYGIFSTTGLKALKGFIKEGLKKYFEVKTDGELKEMLLNVDDINNISLPSSSPFFTKEGLTLIYSQYEIAPYAAGMPEVVIPYNKVKALLKNASIVE